jgi:hypothetical protein
MLAEVSKRRNKRRSGLALVATGQHAGGGAVAALKARKPDVSVIRAGTVAQMPRVAGFTELDRVGQIKAVLRSFEEGSAFEDAAKLADAMLRDDRINGVGARRWGALVGSEIEVKGATEKKRDVKIAELIKGSDEQPGLWHKMFPANEVTELLCWGRMLGACAAEIVWNYDDPTFSTFTIRVWHPQFLRWNHERAVYQLRTMAGIIDLPSTEENPRSDGKWIIYTPYGYRAPWRRALMRPLAMLYLCRQWAYRDWSRYSEKHGMPADVLEIPDNAPDDEKGKVMQDIANRGSEAAVFLPGPKDKDSPGYKFTIVEPVGRSWEAFEKLIAKIEVDIAVLIVGQNLTTEVSDKGSRAAAQVHEGVNTRVLMEDAGLADVLKEQGLSHWAERNYGDVAVTPRPAYVVQEREDELKEAQTLEALGGAIMALQLSGIDCDIDAFANLWGIPVQPKDDKNADARAVGGQVQLTPSALAAIVKVNEARAAAGVGPLLTAEGTPHPDGDLTVAEFQAKHAATVATAAQAEAGTAGAGDSGGQQQEGGAPPKPPANDNAVVAAGFAQLVRIAEAITGRDPEATRARLNVAPGPQTAGHRRTAKYADALKAAAKWRAGQALKQDLAGLLEDIDKATSPDDLKARIVRRYKGSDASTLSRVFERANIMAHMAGRMGVLEEI